MRLEHIVEKGLRLGSMGLLAGAFAIAGGACQKKPQGPSDVVSSVPVWEVLFQQSIEEDSPAGTLVYANLSDKVSYDGELLLGALPNASFQTYFDGKDLKIRNLAADYAGSDTVRVRANEVPASFVLHVMPVDDPPSWQVLQDQGILSNSLDGTIVYENIEMKLTDPDTPKSISILGGNAHFEAYYERPDLRIRNLEENWTGTDSIRVLGNGLRTGFILAVHNQNTTWSPVPDVSCNEDSPEGFVLLRDLDTYADDPDDPLDFDAHYDLGQVKLKVAGNDLVIDQLLANWHGKKRFSLRCNGVSSNEIGLTVESVDDPAQWIVPLPDTVLDNAPADGTLVVGSLSDHVVDVDSPVSFAITTSHPYQLYLQGDDLFLRDVPEEYSDTETVGVVGNGVADYFSLRIRGPFLELVKTLEVNSSYDIIKMYVDENLIIGVGAGAYYLDTKYFAFDRSYQSLGSEITGRYINLYTKVNGKLFYFDRFDQQSGDFSERNPQTFGFVQEIPDVKWMSAIDSNQGLVYFFYSDEMYTMNPNSLEISDPILISPDTYDRTTVHVTDDHIVIGRTPAGYRAGITALDKDTRQQVFTDALEYRQIWVRSTFHYSDQYYANVSEHKVRIYDQDFNVIRTDDWEDLSWYRPIDSFAMSDKYYYVSRDTDGYGKIINLLTGEERALIDMHLSDDSVGFFGDYFYGGYGSHMYIYQLND